MPAAGLVPGDWILLYRPGLVVGLVSREIASRYVSGLLTLRSDSKAPTVFIFLTGWKTDIGWR